MHFSLLRSIGGLIDLAGQIGCVRDALLHHDPTFLDQMLQGAIENANLQVRMYGGRKVQFSRTDGIRTSMFVFLYSLHLSPTTYPFQRESQRCWRDYSVMWPKIPAQKG